MSYFMPPFIASVVAALITTSGIITIQHFEAFGRKYVLYFTSFAAGILISVSFLNLVPVAFQNNAIFAPYGLLIGYLFMYILNRFITRYVCDQSMTDNSNYRFGLIPMVGIGFHSFIDGIIYAITFSVSTFFGILATSGMVMHEFPEGVVTYLLLIHSGFNKKVSFILAFFAAALTTPLGVVVASPFLRHLDSESLGMLLSLSAGCLIYVAATHLLPHVEEKAQKYNIIALIIGVVVAILIVYCEHYS